MNYSLKIFSDEDVKFKLFTMSKMSLSEPLEIQLARKRFLGLRTLLEDRVQTLPVRRSDSLELSRNIADVAELVSDVERAWRVNTEEIRYAAESNARAVEDLRGQLATSRDDFVEVSSSNAKLKAAYADLQRSYSDLLRESDDKVIKAVDQKRAELEVWKEQYTKQMREYVQSKLLDTRQSAAKDQQSAVDHALTGLESEYRKRTTAMTAQLQEARAAEQAARRELVETRRRAEVAEARATLLSQELDMLRGRCSEAEGLAGETSDNARQLADEVLRLKSMLDLERRAHEEIVRIQALKHRHELEIAQSAGAGVMASAEDAHRMEIDRIQRTFEASTRSREELISSWRTKYASAAQRAETAESLLREIDRQLVPAMASSSLSGGSLSASVSPIRTGSSSHYMSSSSYGSAASALGQQSNAAATLSAMGASVRSTMRLHGISTTPAGSASVSNSNSPADKYAGLHMNGGSESTGASNRNDE